MAYKLAEEDKLCGVIYPTYEGFSPIPKATCEMLESKCDELDIEINCGGKKEEKPSELQSTSKSVSQSESTSVSTSLSTSESTSKSESISESTSETTSTSLSKSESTSTSESTSVSDSTYTSESTSAESVSTSESNTTSTSESTSDSTSTSKSDSTSSSESTSTSESNSVSESTSESTTTSESTSVSESESSSNMGSEVTSDDTIRRDMEKLLALLTLGNLNSSQVGNQYDKLSGLKHLNNEIDRFKNKHTDYVINYTLTDPEKEPKTSYDDSNEYKYYIKLVATKEGKSTEVSMYIPYSNTQWDII